MEEIEANPPIPTNSSADELTQYFSKILPDYDEDRVYNSDIKKVIKWFTFLNDRGLLTLEEVKSEEEE